ncbi:hypothetical protein Pint_15154 [Pistacia integerrima]|uniref:Uncharacterized protein n=1 Tax=Pistacia integerrima TaxID=434235 RepID=A0ACC0ZFD8_9ROSI|nr:hypothetical protein Pint_15154 [Pistacia integerrima]
MTISRFDAVSMEKLSPKSPVIYEKYKSGCAWCLIGLCDFSQGHSNKKLISNRGLPNSNVADIIREEEKITTSRENGLAKNHRRKANKTFKRHGCMDVSTVVHTQPSNENLVGMPSKRFNGAASIETSCNQVHPKSGKVCCRRVNSQKNGQLSEINLQVQMSEAAEAFINQKIVKGKYYGRDQSSNQSKHFLDALEILNSNKELFMKLLHDPNSLLVKHIQDLRDSQAKNQETKLSETCDRFPSKGSVDPQPSNRILLPKSGSSGSTYMQNSAGETGHFSSPQSLYSLRDRAQSGKPAYFSFEHMKRKLRHAIGLSRKGKPLLSTVTLHKSSRDNQGLGDGNKENDLGVTGSNSPCKICLGSIDNKTGDKVGKVKDFDSGTRQKVALKSGTSHENSKLSIVRHPKESELNMYMESRQHLPEVLRNRNEILLRKQFSRTLERIISFPEYHFFSALSPRRHQEHGSIAARMRFSPFSNHQMVNEKRKMLQGGNKNSHLSSLRQIAEVPSWTDDKRLTNQSQTFDTKSNISQNHHSDIKLHEYASSADYTSSAIGSMKVVETYNTIKAREVSSLGALEPNVPNHAGADQNAVLANTVEENSLECAKLVYFDFLIRLLGVHLSITSFYCLLFYFFSQTCLATSFLATNFGISQDSPEESCTSVSPEDVNTSSPLSSKSLENSAATKDKAEHQSPVSVLEKFVEDISSPSTISQPAELAVEPKQINYEEQCSAAVMMSPVDLKIHSSNVINEHEPMSKYMRAVLEAAGINWDELSLKSHSSDQLLDPSLFDEVELLPNEFCVDHMLLCDYINEVLGELCLSYFSCSPWLSFAKQIRPAKNMVYEVMKCVDWNLLAQQSTPTLDQLIEKDLARPGTWVNIRIEAEETINEMVESLLEELTLETAIHLSI